MLRRAVLTALLAVAALSALPNAANAALDWGSCVDFDGVSCATLSVPLDRTGVDPGTINLRIGRVGKTSGKTLMYLSGGPGGAGFSEMLSVLPSFPDLVDNYRLIGYDQRGTGRSGLLRCPKLEKDPQLRDTAAAAECAEQIGIARRHYTTPDSVQDMEAIRAELGVEQADAVRHLLRHRARARLRARLPAARRAPDPRLGRRLRRPRPVLHRRLPRDGPVAEVAVPAALPLPHARPGRRARRSSWPSSARSRCSALVYNARGRSQQHEHHARRALRPDVPDGLPPVAARDAPDRRPRRARGRRRAARARCCASPSASTRSARRATSRSPATRRRARPTRCRGTSERRSISARRSSSSASRRSRRARSRPSTPAVVTEDEIDLCLRWPDVPRPASATPAPPYPNVPTLILQGGEDLRTPPEWSARIQQRIPGAVRLVIPGVGHSTVTTRAPARSTRSPTSRATAGRRRRARACRPASPRSSAAPRASSRCAATRACRRKVGRTVRAVAATIDDLRLVLSPAALGELRRRAARRLVGGPQRPADPARLRGRPRRDGVGHGQPDLPPARRGRQGRARDAHAGPGAASRARSAGGGSPSAPARRASAAPPPCARWRADIPESGQARAPSAESPDRRRGRPHRSWTAPLRAPLTRGH